MKKTLFLSCFVFLFYYAAISQSVKTGQPYSIVKDMYRVFIPNSDEVLVIKSTDKVASFYKINTKTLTCTPTNEVKLPKGIMTLESVVELGGKHYVFYTCLDQSKYVSLYAGEIDLAAGSFKGELKFLNISDCAYQMHPNHYYVKNPYGIELGGATFLSVWDFRLSYDKEKLLLVRNKYNKQNINALEIVVLDKNLKTVFIKELRELPSNLDKKNVGIKTTDYVVDSDDNIYIASVASNPNNMISTTRIAEFVKVTSEGKASVIPFNLSSEYIPRKTWVREGANGQIKVIIGYGKSSKNNYIDGFAIGDLQNDNVINLIYTETPISSTENMYDYRSWVLDNVIKEKDGSLICIFELRFIDIDKLSYYRMKDNIIIKIAPDQTIAWAKNLPKNQTVGSNEGESGYKYIRGEDAHYLLFMESLNSPNKYEPTKPAEEFIASQRGFLACYKIDHESGAVTKQQILNTKEMGISDAHTCKLVQIGSNKVIFEVNQSKKEVLLQFDLK